MLPLFQSLWVHTNTTDKDDLSVTNRADILDEYLSSIAGIESNMFWLGVVCTYRTINCGMYTTAEGSKVA